MQVAFHFRLQVEIGCSMKIQIYTSFIGLRKSRDVQTILKIQMYALIYRQILRDNFLTEINQRYIL